MRMRRGIVRETRKAKMAAMTPTIPARIAVKDDWMNAEVHRMFRREIQ